MLCSQNLFFSDLLCTPFENSRNLCINIKKIFFLLYKFLDPQVHLATTTARNSLQCWKEDKIPQDMCDSKIISLCKNKA